MITTANYFESMKHVDFDKLPATFKKGHEVVMLTTSNGQTWDVYKTDADLHHIIDAYISKLNEVEAKKEAEKPTSVAVRQKERKPRTKAPKQEIAEKPAQEFIAKTERKKGKYPVAKARKVKTNFRKEKYQPRKKAAVLRKGKEPKPPVYVKRNSLEIQLIKRYLNMDGKPRKLKGLESLYKQMATAIKEGKIVDHRSLIETISGGINAAAKKAHKAGAETLDVKLDKETKAKAIKAVAGISLKARFEYFGGLGKSNATVKANIPPKGIVTVADIAGLEFTEIPLTGYYASILGKPADGFKMMVYGQPFHGKTVWLLKLADYLAKNFGPVLYVSNEENGTYTLKKKLKDFNITSQNIGFSSKIERVDEFRFLIIDSATTLKLRLEDFKKLKENYPALNIIVVLQTTKAGEFRGGRDWEHEVDIAMEIFEHEPLIYKNRFADKTTSIAIDHKQMQKEDKKYKDRLINERKLLFAEDWLKANPPHKGWTAGKYAWAVENLCH